MLQTDYNYIFHLPGFFFQLKSGKILDFTLFSRFLHGLHNIFTLIFTLFIWILKPELTPRSCIFLSTFNEIVRQIGTCAFCTKNETANLYITSASHKKPFSRKIFLLHQEDWCPAHLCGSFYFIRNSYKEKRTPKEFPSGFLAGLQGFEPWNDGVRVRCLTVWR